MSHRHRRTAASIAWSLVLLSTLLALSALVLKIINGATLQQIILESPPIGVELALTFPIVGAVIAARHPYNPLGWIFCAIGLSQGVVELSYDYARRTLVLEPGSLPGGDLMAWLSSWTWIPGFGLLITFSLLLFPTGHLVSRRWRYVAWIAAGVMTMMVLLISVALWPYRGSALLANNERLSAGADAALSLFEIGLVILLASAARSLISLIVRYRRARGEERLQLRWFTFTAVLMIFPVLVSTYEGLPLAVNRVGSLFALLVAPCLPTAIGVAILKHRLYDIDVVINRTLVYGSLAAFITGVYVAVVVGVGGLIGQGDRPNLALSVTATAVVALLFQPVRARIGRFANRVVFGARATPYEVMSNLGRDMAQVLGVEDVLPRLAEIAAAGVGAARAKATLILGDGATRSAVWPADSAKDSFDAVLAIEDDSETVGEIAVAKRPGDALTPSDHKLLRDLAAQAAVVLANARLAAELRARLDDIAVQADELKASRERIVSAADASRKRLEQDIAAGCELKLRALIAELDLVHESLGEGTVDVGVLFDRIAAQAAETLDELRNVARGIFPPLLADKGLVSAIEAYVAKLDGGVVLEVADGIHDARFERGIESAIYFCCIEGIQHVANYWRAKCAVVALEQVDGEVTFAITGDSGGWRKEEERSGPALINMADRLAALGGGVEVTFEAGVGTTVTGRVPAGVMEVMG